MCSCNDKHAFVHIFIIIGLSKHNSPEKQNIKSDKCTILCMMGLSGPFDQWQSLMAHDHTHPKYYSVIENWTDGTLLLS